MTAQFRNLIFESGGVKGIAYVGAMQVLEQRGIVILFLFYTVQLVYNTA